MTLDGKGAPVCNMKADWEWTYSSIYS